MRDDHILYWSKIELTLAKHEVYLEDADKLTVLPDLQESKPDSSTAHAVALRNWFSIYGRLGRQTEISSPADADAPRCESC